MDKRPRTAPTYYLCPTLQRHSLIIEIASLLIFTILLLTQVANRVKVSPPQGLDVRDPKRKASIGASSHLPWLLTY